MNAKEIFMNAALKEAEKAYALGETPIGAVVVKDGEIVERISNIREAMRILQIY